MANRPLTELERKKIWEVVGQDINPDDRDPKEIIHEDYNGDTDDYLRVMARWHRITLNGGQI